MFRGCIYRCKKFKFLALFLFLCLFLCLSVSCTHLQSVSLTQIPTVRKNVISAEASRIIILGLIFDTDFVEEVVESLRDKCPNGKVKGILTKHEDIDYFLSLLYKKRIIAKGYCTKM